jgi:hypothetical protein
MRRERMPDMILVEWHPWFAWYPVLVDDGYPCWLRWIWRAGWKVDGEWVREIYSSIKPID